MPSHDLLQLIRDAYNALDALILVTEHFEPKERIEAINNARITMLRLQPFAARENGTYEV